jgi:hypothetical protein
MLGKLGNPAVNDAADGKPGKPGKPGKLGNPAVNDATDGNSELTEAFREAAALAAVALAASLAAATSLNFSGFIFSLDNCCRSNLAILGKANVGKLPLDASAVDVPVPAIPGKFIPFVMADATADAGSCPKAMALAFTALSWSKLRPPPSPLPALAIAADTPPLTIDTCDCS